MSAEISPASILFLTLDAPRGQEVLDVFLEEQILAFVGHHRLMNQTLQVNVMVGKRIHCLLSAVISSFMLQKPMTSCVGLAAELTNQRRLLLCSFMTVHSEQKCHLSDDVACMVALEGDST